MTYRTSLVVVCVCVINGYVLSRERNVQCARRTKVHTDVIADEVVCANNTDCLQLYTPGIDEALIHGSDIVYEPFCDIEENEEFGTCSCGDYCLSRSSTFENEDFFYCGPCGRVGSVCNESSIEACDKEWVCSGGGYCACPKGGQFYEVYYCYIPYYGYEVALQMAVTTCIIIVLCLLVASIYNAIGLRRLRRLRGLREFMRGEEGVRESPPDDIPPKYEDVIEDDLPTYQEALSFEEESRPTGIVNMGFEDDTRNEERSREISPEDSNQAMRMPEPSRALLPPEDPTDDTFIRKVTTRSQSCDDYNIQTRNNNAEMHCDICRCTARKSSEGCVSNENNRNNNDDYPNSNNVCGAGVQERLNKDEFSDGNCVSEAGPYADEPSEENFANEKCDYSRGSNAGAERVCLQRACSSERCCHTALAGTEEGNKIKDNTEIRGLDRKQNNDANMRLHVASREEILLNNHASKNKNISAEPKNEVIIIVPAFQIRTRTKRIAPTDTAPGKNKGFSEMDHTLASDPATCTNAILHMGLTLSDNREKDTVARPSPYSGENLAHPAEERRGSGKGISPGATFEPNLEANSASNATLWTDRTRSAFPAESSGNAGKGSNRGIDSVQMALLSTNGRKQSKQEGNGPSSQRETDGVSDEGKKKTEIENKSRKTESVL